MREVMRDTPTSKSSASGRDITRSGGDVKAIAPQFLDGFEENLDFSPGLNQEVRRVFGSWEEFEAYIAGGE